jgi:methyl-accepting chemotaxis protein
MHKFVPTIRFRLAVAFGLPAILTAAYAVLSNAAVRVDMGVYKLTWSLPVIALTTIALLVAGYFHLYRIVCDGLAKQARSFQYLAETLNLSRRSAARRMDEFGRGAIWFDRFMRRVEDTVVTVRASTESVSAATQQIAAGNMDLSSRTEKQAASLEETAASMTELAVMVTRNADSAREADSLAASASTMAERGHEAVQALVSTITAIETESTKISDITALIEGIAFQTNILALNAAVEAARAGDQGRGFAVVAGEVRVLAQRSASAAKEINALIASSTAMIHGGSRQAQAAGATVEQVKLAIGAVSAEVAAIASASERQGQSVQHVAEALAQIDEATQQNAALVEQAAAAAQSLDEQVVKVRGTLDEFRVADRRATLVA